MAQLPARAIVRMVLLVVGTLVGLYLLYLVRKPLGWLAIALFLAVALSGPVNRLSQHMRRGFAIACVYLVLLLVPAALTALIVPPLVTQANNFATDVPGYVQDLKKFVNRNHRLRKINRDYKVTEKLQKEAEKLPGKLGGAAGTLRDVGIGIVNSIFQLVTILILTAFMLGGGRGWIEAALRQLPAERAARMRRVMERSAAAVGNYVAGALAQATLAGVTSFIVLKILGVPFAAPLAVLIFFLDLIPLVGATLGAAIVGVVTLFVHFPTATIIWVIWSIVYQQVENNVIQPQIQKRAVDVPPFLVIVAVLFGAALLGVVGALVAVPVAATIRIVVYEFQLVGKVLEPAEPEPPPAPAGG